MGQVGNKMAHTKNFAAMEPTLDVKRAWFAAEAEYKQAITLDETSGPTLEQLSAQRDSLVLRADTIARQLGLVHSEIKLAEATMEHLSAIEIYRRAKEVMDQTFRTKLHAMLEFKKLKKNTEEYM